MIIKAFMCGVCLFLPATLSQHKEFHFKQNDYHMKFERMELYRYNKQAINKFTVLTYKYNRTCPLVNMTWNYKIEIGRNLQVVTQAYKFMSNEYRLFPLRLEVNVCSALKANLLGMAAAFKCGNYTECTISKGITYHFCMWAPDESQFPPYMPDGNYMLDMQGLFASQEMFVWRAYGSVSRPIIIK